jgi:nicotinamidase-related amidase
LREREARRGGIRKLNDSFSLTDAGNSARRRMFLAAFTSRSCHAPQRSHIQRLTRNPLTPCGTVSDPPDEQLRLVFHSLRTATLLPDIARLLAVWRSKEWPISHVPHDSRFADSAYRPGQIGNQFQPEAAPQPGAMIVPKRTNSAFIGTDLERHLRASALATIVVSGVSTNNSVAATVRMAGNLGFQTYLVADACFTFARRDCSGRLRTADEVHSRSLANLQEEYCMWSRRQGCSVNR